MKTKLFFLLLSFVLLFPFTSYGQTEDYQTANQLIQQQRYEEALPIIRSLYEQNPRSFVYFDRYTRCLINLKQFDEAEEVARNQAQNSRFQLQASTKLAEILHLKGEREKALETWNQIIERNRGSQQAYYATGNSMTSRQEFDAAVELYNEAREDLNNDSLFLNELANTYLQAGRFEESVEEYFRLIVQSPDQMSLVQQRFLRMRDDKLYEIAAFELEDQLLQLDTEHQSYSPLYQLLIWLLLETDEHQRAFVFARQYENQTEYSIYSLFSLGNQLLSARNFELATQAFQYYTDSTESSLRFRAKESLAAAYREWGEYLKQNNIETSSRQDEKFSRSYEVNQQLLDATPNYENAPEIYSNLIDLSVDFYKDIDKAETWYNHMQRRIAAGENPYLYYAEGRIALFRKDFVTARQALTRADKQSDESELSEKTRYYLSLSDFFAGDFDFAEIQLKTLERRNTSYYANDAIKLRMWIKNGLRADSTGSLLETIGNSLYSIHIGNYNEALRQLEPILAQTNHSFSDDLILELSKELPDQYNRLKLQLVDRAIQSQPYSPLKERLLWDQVTLIEYFMKNIDLPPPPPNMYTYSFLDSNVNMEFTEQNLVDLYEEILIEFPNGFYAPFVREKLENMETAST
ncbi:tetratricopeptide repeat protein [Rhodohalobacter sulfatireducens]|uniref:Tetratricopeptide repeat protein n=1 Tax=Rhodohalobacter sulfatireducens TaxID=2911366 RepID=A0ABS9KB41_9BACT|nr:tetratricopeptide repeat protein [Rhodohalobacter sulfatireducens]MCG2588051.1 tetratricopeptide repeat protein [Rhodohalobacter sulfatireducens]